MNFFWIEFDKMFKIKKSYSSKELEWYRNYKNAH